MYLDAQLIKSEFKVVYLSTDVHETNYPIFALFLHASLWPSLIVKTFQF